MRVRKCSSSTPSGSSAMRSASGRSSFGPAAAASRCAAAPCKVWSICCKYAAAPSASLRYLSRSARSAVSSGFSFGEMRSPPSAVGCFPSGGFVPSGGCSVCCGASPPASCVSGFSMTLSFGYSSRNIVEELFSPTPNLTQHADSTLRDPNLLYVVACFQLISGSYQEAVQIAAEILPNSRLGHLPKDSQRLRHFQVLGARLRLHRHRLLLLPTRARDR